MEGGQHGGGGGGTRDSANVFAVRLMSLCLMYCLNLTIWQKSSPAPEVEGLHQTLCSVLSQKINNTVFSHCKLSAQMSLRGRLGQRAW